MRKFRFEIESPIIIKTLDIPGKTVISNRIVEFRADDAHLLSQISLVPSLIERLETNIDPLITSLAKQLATLFLKERTIMTYDPSTVLIVNFEKAFYIGNELFSYNKKNSQIQITQPFEKAAFLSPAMASIKTIPKTIDIDFHSFGQLIFYMVSGGKTIDEFSEHYGAARPKIYWFIWRCLNEKRIVYF